MIRKRKDKVTATILRVLNSLRYPSQMYFGDLAKISKRRWINWSQLKEATAIVADASAVAQLLGVGAILGSVGDQHLNLLFM